MTRHVGVGREIARATGLPARPDRDGRDFHPGVIAWPGSISTLAALSASLDTRSTARTPQLPKRPGGPNSNPGRDFHNGLLPVVSARQTPRCSTRGLFFSEGRVIRAPQNSLCRYVCQDTAQDFAKSLGLSAPLGNGVRHERQSGGRFVPNPRKVFTFAGKEDERRS